MRIGYAKLGRSIQLPERLWSPAGDHEAPQLLRRLANATPEHTWVLLGRSRGWEEWDAPPNVENPWADLNVPSYLITEEDEKRGHENFVARAHELIDSITRDLYPAWRDLDGFVLWFGQHGSAHIPIPRVTNFHLHHMVKPFLFAVNYGGYLNRIINLWQDSRNGAGPVVALCADPRNVLKSRDVKWPPTGTVLAQGTQPRRHRHYRFGDPRTPQELGVPGKLVEEGGGCWEVEAQYEHASAELAVLPDDWATWGERPFDRRNPTGVGCTSYWVDRADQRRSWYVKNWLLYADPQAELFVKPDVRCAQELEGCTLYDNPPDAFHDVLARWRCTITLPPPAGKGMWTVAKPWQCFAARTVCFHVGPGDAHGWIVPTRTRVDPARQVAPGWYSVRDDWTAEDLVLADWLRVRDRDDLRAKVAAVTSDPNVWGAIVEQQRSLLSRRWGELERNVLDRLGIGAQLHAVAEGVS